MDYTINRNSFLSTMPNFPHIRSKLNDRGKYGVITSEMVRFSRRCDDMRECLRHINAYLEKLCEFGYDRQRVIAKVKAFRHWPKHLGQWEAAKARVLRRLIQEDLGNRNYNMHI